MSCREDWVSIGAPPVAGERVSPQNSDVAARTFYYGTFRPDDTLRGVIENYWLIQAERCRTAVEAALADAAVEIYFNLGPHGRQVYDGSAGAGLPRLPRRTAWVIGPHAGTLLVAKETRACDIVGVRVRPGAATALLGVPVAELGDTLVDLDVLWGSDATDVVDQLASTDDDRARVTIVERAIARRLVAAASRQTSHGVARQGPLTDADDVSTLCESIGALGDVSVGELARRYGFTHRQVIALFDRHVGLKPKAFHRVQRLRTVIEAIGSTTRPAWARIAADNGYCDQAHLIHDFRKLTGLTPGGYAAKRTSVGHGAVPYRLATGAMSDAFADAVRV